jgi:hypothetical protein
MRVSSLLRRLARLTDVSIASRPRLGVRAHWPGRANQALVACDERGLPWMVNPWLSGRCRIAKARKGLPEIPKGETHASNGSPGMVTLGLREAGQRSAAQWVHDGPGNVLSFRASYSCSSVPKSRYAPRARPLVGPLRLHGSA